MPPHDMDPPPPPRADGTDALAWLLLGAAVLGASLRMDRLESQDVPPFAAPGLLPGLLGIGLLLMGGALGLRSLRAPRTETATGTATGSAMPRGARGRAALVIALCVLFGAGLVGHGLPFWLAAAVFVAAAILLLQQPGAAGRGVRGVLVAAAVGLGAGGVVTLVFQQVFLVRLP